VLVDLAVMIADGGEAIADIDVLRHQDEVFGPVASDTTVWRALDEIGAGQLRRIARARAKVRVRLWQLFGGAPPAASSRYAPRTESRPRSPGADASEFAPVT
jgi:hypothetical protein